MNKKQSLILGLVAVVIIVVIILFYSNRGGEDNKIYGDIHSGLPGNNCSQDIECETPDNFMIRSSCPFFSVCSDGKCKVVCQSWDSEVQCNGNSDCNCSSFYAGRDVIRCSCLNGNCSAIVAE